MRLETAAPAETAPAPPLRHEHELAASRSLRGLYYSALWVHLSVLAALIHLPRGPGLGFWVPVVVWSALLGLVVILAASLRLAIQDMLIALSPRERVGLGALVFCAFMLPAFTPRAGVLTDGFLWAAVLIVLLAVTPSISRQLLAWTLLGGWLAALATGGGAGGGGWTAVGLAALFGASWLAALGATHYLYTGEPYGLGGAWPVARLARSLVAVFIPAGLAAVAMLWVWTALSPTRRPAPDARPDPRRVEIVEAPRRPIDQLDRITLYALIWRGAASLLLVFVAFVLLLYLRRKLLGKRGQTPVPEILPGQTARMEYDALPPRPPALRLPGRRGQVAALWGRWAQAMGRATRPRAPGETAARFADRLARQPNAGPRAITGLLEGAHYGPAEPTYEDVERMRRLVSDELLQLSLERQEPVDALPSEERLT